MKDDSGILSIDFIIGFTIFLIAFITVITLCSGLILGLQSKTIDYDAVAYRTGVILAEDPGYAFNPKTNNYTKNWELVSPYYPQEVKRIGFAVSRTTPGIFSEEKVAKFKSLYDNSDDYKIRTVFGDYPYQYNISIRSLGNSQMPIFIGNSVPISDNNKEWGGYGYIRRSVKIKEPSNTSVDVYYGFNNSVEYRYLKINFDFPALDVIDPTYSISPLTERISINITNISSTLNSTNPVKLLDVKLYQDNLNLPDDQDTPYPKPVDKRYLSTNATNPFITTSSLPLVTTGNVTDWLKIELNPEFFSEYNVDSGKQYYLKLTFDPQTTYMGGSYSYDYSTVTNPPYLIPAVMEVRVW